MKPIISLVTLNIHIVVLHTLDYFWEPRFSLPSQCGKREYYIECGNRCKLNCFTVQIPVPCNSPDCLAGCYCRGGYLRKSKGGPCIPEEFCKMYAPPDAHEIEAEMKDLFEEIETQIRNEQRDEGKNSKYCPELKPKSRNTPKHFVRHHFFKLYL
ncbi:hypothetical protein ILUMI_24683 [Ignelater luminosus]|uniref:TIL domain-containing protein n=1 Tax=Ignelater luminosus TaxID=2038154 RepID=A0A8K0CD07_IGNLU|nr:hypothetical protein ILUMI_24683 [Ignelater luminosus]